MSAELTPAQLDQVRAFAERGARDFEFFAATCLKIRTKKGEVVPFKLNRAQRHLHQALERQRAKTGRVRAIVLKGRQVGISTYIQARYYWRLWGSRLALRAFILTHEDAATANLFGMAQRFQEHMPPHLRPKTKAANAKELLFSANDCGYQVATAGGKEVGRSSTIQLFHGSECAFWPNAEDHTDSVLNTALSTGAGTEALLESTGNGIGNVFYRMAMEAVKGNSEYEAVFVPWYWDDDCRERCPKTFATTISDEWRAYGESLKLEWDQLYWAYLKNRSMAQARSLDPEKICAKFRQEFSSSIDDCFQTSGDSFIPGSSVLAARKPEETVIGRGPVILGIDPARDRDKVGIIDRCGRRAGERICERWDPDGDTIYLAQRLAVVIDRINPDAVNIDIGSNGAGVYDQLIAMGYEKKLNPVNFGSAPLTKGPTADRMYLNRRAEMWDLMRDWFETPGGVQVPDDDGLHVDITAPMWGPTATRYNTGNALVLEDKEKLKERIGRSCDIGDALALTFAVPFAAGFMPQTMPRTRGVRRKSGGY